HRAARLAGMKEGLPVDLAGHRVVGDVAADEALVVVAKPGVEPEGFDADDLLLLVSHRAGDVQDVDDDRIRLPPRGDLPGAVAPILPVLDDHRISRVVGAGDDLPLERLAEGAAKVAQRLGSGGVDAHVARLLGDDAVVSLGLDARKLQLLPEDLGQLVEADVDLEEVMAGGVAGLALAIALCRTVAGRSEDGADLALALAHAALLLWPVAEAGDFDGRHGNGDEVLPPLADHLPFLDEPAQVLLDAPPDDRLEARVVLVDLERHLRPRNASGYSLASPLAKIDATKFSTSVAQISQ